MLDAWDATFVLLLLGLVLAMPKISPCVGCIGQDVQDDCRKDCHAFLAYQKQTRRL